MSRMLLALALALAALAPAWAELKIDKIRTAYGPLGPERDDGQKVEVYAGQELFFRYNVLGAALNDEGAINATVQMRILGPDGKEVLKESTPIKGMMALGGNQFPGTARVAIGEKAVEGSYKMTITVTDETAKQSAEFTRELSVKKFKAITLISRRFFRDPKGEVPAGAGGMVDQKLFFRMQLAGFDKSQKKIAVRMELQAFDADGNALMAKPLIVNLATQKEEEVANANVLTFNGNLALNRPGDFKLRFKFIDGIGKNELLYEVPLKVLE